MAISIKEKQVLFNKFLMIKKEHIYEEIESSKFNSNFTKPIIKILAKKPKWIIFPIFSIIGVFQRSLGYHWGKKTHHSYLFILHKHLFQIHVNESLLVWCLQRKQQEEIEWLNLKTKEQDMNFESQSKIKLLYSTYCDLMHRNTIIMIVLFSI